jgi:microcystin-dependent protein
MADAFLGEIRTFAGNFAPQGWAFCDGQLLSISQNTALFALLGTFYGGDGRTTFALPNLQGRLPLNAGNGAGLSAYTVGDSGGTESVTLAVNQMPAHRHTAQSGNSTGTKNSPDGAVWAAAHSGRVRDTIYATNDPGTAQPMSPNAISTVGGGQPHNNMPPYLVLTFIIALQGIFPARD